MGGGGGVQGKCDRRIEVFVKIQKKNWEGGSGWWVGSGWGVLYNVQKGIVQEAFHVYLNKFEIVVTHLFFVILCKSCFT